MTVPEMPEPKVCFAYICPKCGYRALSKESLARHWKICNLDRHIGRYIRYPMMWNGEPKQCYGRIVKVECQCGEGESEDLDGLNEHVTFSLVTVTDGYNKGGCGMDIMDDELEGDLYGDAELPEGAEFVERAEVEAYVRAYADRAIAHVMRELDSELNRCH